MAAAAAPPPRRPAASCRSGAAALRTPRASSSRGPAAPASPRARRCSRACARAGVSSLGGQQTRSRRCCAWTSRSRAAASPPPAMAADCPSLFTRRWCCTACRPRARPGRVGTRSRLMRPCRCPMAWCPSCRAASCAPAARPRKWPQAPSTSLSRVGAWCAPPLSRRARTMEVSLNGGAHFSTSAPPLLLETYSLASSEPKSSPLGGGTNLTLSTEGSTAARGGRLHPHLPLCMRR